MAKLVIGTNKQNGVPAVVRDMSPTHYIEYPVDANGIIQFPQTVMSFKGVKGIGANTLQNAYRYNTAISGEVDLSDIERITTNGANAMFSYASNITGVDLSNCEEITANGSGQMFDNCSKLQTVKLGKLRVIGSRTDSYMGTCFNMFNSCKITGHLDLSKLEFIGGGNAANQMFNGNTGITSVDLSSLYEIYNNTGSTPAGSMLSGCKLVTCAFPSLALVGKIGMTSFLQYNSTLQDVWFYALTPSSFGNYTDQFTNLLRNISGCTVHFPMAIQNTISSWSDVTAGFGGTNTTILYDIVTSLVGADGNTYTRKEKESTSTATAWTYNNTLYYTSGVSNHTAGVHEPTVGTTIYSDASCTTAVTTVASIA